MPLAAIGIGANLGDRASTMHAAIERLGSLGSVLAVSSFCETEPVGYAGQPFFLNGALLLQTALHPMPLLRRLLAIELEFGRDRSHGIAKGPRTLDLDLLLYDAEVVHTGTLTLPHPEMARRRFVLGPLAEIAPDWVHPTELCTIRALLARLY